MNNNTTLLFLIAVFSFCSWAQGISKAEWLLEKTKVDTSYSHSVWFSGDFRQNSNGIPNDFLMKFVFPSFIDESTKNNASERLNNSNKLGLTLQSETGYSTRLKKDSKTLLNVSYGYFDYSAVRFSRDFFQLVFRGNKIFEGKTAQLENSELEIHSFQTINIGLTKESESKAVRYGAELGLANGFRNQSLVLSRGSLFTGLSGDELLLDVKGDYVFNEKGRLVNGNGFVLGGWVALNKNEKHQLFFGVKNLGFMRWNNLSRYRKDSTYQFNGLEVGEIFNPNENIVSNSNSTTIQGLLRLRKERTSFVKLLPFDLNLNYSYSLSPKTQLYSGVDYFHLVAYAPRVFGGVSHRVNQLKLHSSLSFGGFGRLDYLFGLNYAAKRFSFFSEFQIIEPLFLSRRSSGVGISLGAVYKFGAVAK